MNAIAIAIGAGAPGIPTPSFFLPFADAGAGAVNTTAVGNGSATFTRATAAWTWNSSGLLVQVNSGVARSCYTPLTGAAYLKYLSEQQSTNEALWSRDATNAAWTKTSVTAAKDQTGIDGTAAAASSLLATGANGTCTQAIVSASNTARRFSVYMKRLVGTGQILMSLDNGVTTSNVAASINASTYTRVGTGQTLANPTLMFKIVTSGDKVAVDVMQEEALAFDTSPILTTTVAVTRNADSLTYPLAGNISNTAGTAFAEFTSTVPASARIIGDDAGTPAPLYAPTGNSVGVYDGTTTVGSGASGSVGAVHKAASYWSGASMSAFIDGANKGTGVYDGVMNTVSISIGMGGGVPLNGTVGNVKIWTTALTDAQVAAL